MFCQGHLALWERCLSPGLTMSPTLAFCPCRREGLMSGGNAISKDLLTGAWPQRQSMVSMLTVSPFCSYLEMCTDGHSFRSWAKALQWHLDAVYPKNCTVHYTSACSLLGAASPCAGCPSTPDSVLQVSGPSCILSSAFWTGVEFLACYHQPQVLHPQEMVGESPSAVTENPTEPSGLA